MQKLLLLSLLSIIIFMTSCSKSVPEVTPTPTSVMMEIDDVAWTGEALTNNTFNDQLSVNGFKSSDKSAIALFLESYSGVKSYSSGGQLVYTDSKLENYISESFTINVTSTEVTNVTTKTHGTFQGTLKSFSGKRIIITNGKF